MNIDTLPRVARLALPPREFLASEVTELRDAVLNLEQYIDEQQEQVAADPDASEYDRARIGGMVSLRTRKESILAFLSSALDQYDDLRPTPSLDEYQASVAEKLAYALAGGAQ